MASSIKAAALAVTLGFASFAIAQGAFAQGVKDLTDAEKPGGDGYGYEFEDDPLNAGGFGPNDATIRVRPNAARTTLIRPRTSFVPEMLKSVEMI